MRRGQSPRFERPLKRDIRRADTDVLRLRQTFKPARMEAYGERVDDPLPHPVAGVTHGTGTDYCGMADTYCRDVLDGRIVAGKWTQKAVRRFLEMRRRAEQPGNHYTWSGADACDVCAFAEQCPHVEGKWESDRIQLQPVQVFILIACYGFRVRETGERLVTDVFFQVARKSAKSTLVAIAGLYHLCKESEPGAQVVCAATTGTAARIVFSIMQRMVRKSPYLQSFGLQVWANAITQETEMSSAKPINSKASTQDGLNPSFISLDESHAQKFGLHDVLMSAMGARGTGMMWCPTTAGYDLTSVGYAKRQAAQQILEGVIESDHSFVAIFEIDEGDDWKDERVWIKAAPMIGITPKLEYVRKYAADCIATPQMQGEFQTKQCNLWLHSSARAIDIDQWDRCADQRLTLDQFEHEQCWIGVDLAERDDVAAVALNFRHEDLIVSFVKGFLPADVINERAHDVPEYRVWTRTGELEATSGNMTDFDRIEDFLVECTKRFDVVDIVIERWGAAHLAANLSKRGIVNTVENKNSKLCTPPMTELFARLKTRRFRHQGSSFFRWQASNLCLEKRRDGSMLPVKDGPESKRKIDAFDALVLGWHALLKTSTAQPNLQIFFMGGAR